MVFEERTNSRKRRATQLTGAKYAEATSFIRDVRSAFSQQASPNNYERFLIVLREFKSCSLPLLECFKLIAVLFKDTPHLIHPFNVFAPAGYCIGINAEGRAYVIFRNITYDIPDDILQTYAYVFNPENLPTALTANPAIARGGFDGDENTI